MAITILAILCAALAYVVFQQKQLLILKEMLLEEGPVAFKLKRSSATTDVLLCMACAQKKDGMIARPVPVYEDSILDWEDGEDEPICCYECNRIISM